MELWEKLVAMIGGFAGSAAILGFIIKMYKEAVEKGRRLQEVKEMKEDIDGVGRKADHIRKELQEQVDDVKDSHGSLAREVSEITSTVKSNNDLLQRLVEKSMA